jgi:hypothetical protein
MHTWDLESVGGCEWQYKFSVISAKQAAAWKQKTVPSAGRSLAGIKNIGFAFL